MALTSITQTGLSLEALLESREEGIALVDCEGRFVYLNDAYLCFAKKVFNQTVAPGAYHQETLPGGERSRASALSRRALSGKKFAVEFSRSCPEAGTCYFERSFSPVCRDGQLCGFTEIIRDVTGARKREGGLCDAYLSLEREFVSRASGDQEYNAILAQEIVERQKVEEDLLESRERLAQILQGSSIPTFVIDEKHTITHWNKACEALTGYGASEMVGSQNQWKAFYLSQRPCLADLVVRTSAEEDFSRYYGGKYRKSSLIEGACEAEDFFDFGKHKKWLFFTAAPIKNRAGEVIAAIETFQDITDRKRMEVEIRRMNDELEARVEERTTQLKITYDQLLHAEKLSAVGKLAASIAHEFGNPIIALRNFLKNLRKVVRLGKADSEMLDLAIAECVRIKDLISNLQDFNRPTSGKFAPVDLHRVIEDLLLFSQKSLKDKHVAVERNFAPDLPRIQAVADQIKQVLLNVISNAEEAIPATGGTIGIATEVAGENVRIHIKDSGKGIKQKDIDHIFDPFYSTKPAVEGTGLGLSVSYGIIKRHGGTITARSEGGQGAVFTITLPIKGTPLKDTVPLCR